jgi:hypothetical protein
MQLRPRLFTPEESAPGSHQTDGWVGLTAGVYEQNPCTCREPSHDTSVVRT